MRRKNLLMIVAGCLATQLLAGCKTDAYEIEKVSEKEVEQDVVDTLEKNIEENEMELIPADPVDEEEEDEEIIYTPIDQDPNWKEPDDEEDSHPTSYTNGYGFTFSLMSTEDQRLVKRSNNATGYLTNQDLTKWVLKNYVNGYYTITRTEAIVEYGDNFDIYVNGRVAYVAGSKVALQSYTNDDVYDEQMLYFYVDKEGFEPDSKYLLSARCLLTEEDRENGLTEHDAIQNFCDSIRKRHDNCSPDCNECYSQMIPVEELEQESEEEQA